MQKYKLKYIVFTPNFCGFAIMNASVSEIRKHGKISMCTSKLLFVVKASCNIVYIFFCHIDTTATTKCFSINMYIKTYISHIECACKIFTYIYYINIYFTDNQVHYQLMLAFVLTKADPDEAIHSARIFLTHPQL